jgi:hypothetical protein
MDENKAKEDSFFDDGLVIIFCHFVFTIMAITAAMKLTPEKYMFYLMIAVSMMAVILSLWL